ncbi:MAG: nicotinate-nucleotide adenylyltransferase [Ruminococcaceae bacterium]|nr:nicotinate-nucleotide adenylyltransferase [Oscillospiraceae bacterium]
MKIGILGGTFDPVHKAHIEIAKLSYEKLGLDKVIFIPNGIPPHKNKSLISKEDKLNMLNLAIKDYPYFSVDTFEIDKEGTSFLYLTLEYLNKKYPSADLYFIAGSDNLKTITTWKNPHIIFKLSNIVFVKRPKYKLDLKFADLLKEKYNGKISFIDFSGIDISSTTIREKFEKCEEVSEYLSYDVYSYIVKNSLYPFNLRKKLEKMLDEKRFIHSKNVAKESYNLACHYGENYEKAYYAGLLHDCAKKLDYDAQINIINKYNDYELMENELSYPKVIHALTGALIAKYEFGISNTEILNAIRYHTLGSVKMSTLDKIVYIADLISEDRIYKGVEILKDMAYNNIDKAILMSIENTLNYLDDKRIQPDVLKLKEMLRRL